MTPNGARTMKIQRKIELRVAYCLGYGKFLKRVELHQNLLHLHVPEVLDQASQLELTQLRGLKQEKLGRLVRLRIDVREVALFWKLMMNATAVPMSATGNQGR